MITPSAIN
ncbi:hypothetical protein YPPY76_2211, partial [Yersinia pestis PY-76]